MISRMLRAAALEPALFEEVEHDSSLTWQALQVVLIVSLAAGIGNVFRTGVPGLIVGSIFALLGWAIWSFLIYIIGTTILKTPETKATWGQLLRTIGFASSPGVIRIFSNFTFLGGLVTIIALVWTLAATVIAVRQALDLNTTGRAVAVCLVGWVVNLLLAIFLGLPSFP